MINIVQNQQLSMIKQMYSIKDNAKEPVIILYNK